MYFKQLWIAGMVLAVLTFAFLISPPIFAQSGRHFGMDHGSSIPFLKWKAEDGKQGSTFDLRGSRFRLLIGDETCSRCEDLLKKFEIGEEDRSQLIVLFVDSNGTASNYSLTVSEQFRLRHSSQQFRTLLPRNKEELGFGGDICKPPLPYIALVNETGEIESAATLQ
ncbi:hypothetical protein QA635_39130 [Bradyrhizobium brasilense]|uniref:hypothetical protein n=1 Tax=Bradyrhizobium brasilense TaxID=1419277 RepID=UPI0024B18AF7|nr:hypothetical protein [Bradyrhizobium australafricanum]WFU32426.1 hypothetical protein QA635_39130 [Bradyrhizobium australafricanum]